jgi:hypothetical protein
MSSLRKNKLCHPCGFRQGSCQLVTCRGRLQRSNVSHTQILSVIPADFKPESSYNKRFFLVTKHQLRNEIFILLDSHARRDLSFPNALVGNPEKKITSL